jgi:hypothetical protein
MGSIMPSSPVAQDAHFVGTSTLDLHRTLPVHIHNAVPRRPTRSTAALRDDGVENVASLTLVEDHGLNGIGSDRLNLLKRGINFYARDPTPGSPETGLSCPSARSGARIYPSIMTALFIL